MSLRHRSQPPEPPPPDGATPGKPPDPPRLPQRWVVILGVSTLLGLFAASVGGPVVGITTALIAIGLLHQIMD
jgi:hypothetical protein